MKHVLGSALFTAWLCAAPLNAEEFAYRITSDTTHTRLHAPVHIDVDLNQTDPTNVLLFAFSPRKSDAYRIVQIDATHDDTPHRAHHHYRFELYPLRTGDINVTFSLIKRVTDDRKMAFSASGDRDDFKKLETVDTPIALPPLTLHVAPVTPPADLIGAFTLKARYGKNRAEAYEPVSLHVVIKGKGYPPLLDRLIALPKGVTRFAQPPELRRILTPEGIYYEARYAMAFSGEKSFTLPETTLRAFDPTTQRRYTLRIPAHRVEIAPPNPAAIIDKADAPPPLGSAFAWLPALLSYLAAFGAGAASLWLWQRRPRRQNAADAPHPLAARIDAAKDKDALYRLLLRDAARFAPAIDAMEKNPSLSLKHLKTQAKELL